MAGLNFIETMRGPHWDGLAANARYLNVMAMRAGLFVWFDSEYWVWSGTQERFEESKLFRSHERWNFKQTTWVCTAEGIRAQFHRETNGLILAVHKYFHDYTPTGQKQTLQRASDDVGYQSFRAAMLCQANQISENK